LALDEAADDDDDDDNEDEAGIAKLMGNLVDAVVVVVDSAVAGSLLKLERLFSFKLLEFNVFRAPVAALFVDVIVVIVGPKRNSTKRRRKTNNKKLSSRSSKI
jgi:hypothetical protein